jgi:hypothetical protein
MREFLKRFPTKHERELIRWVRDPESTHVIAQSIVELRINF